MARNLARHQARVALMVMAQTAPEHDPAIVRSALQLVIGSDSADSGRTGFDLQREQLLGCGGNATEADNAGRHPARS